jgi:hypothetical protein
VDQPIEHPCGQQLEPGLALTISADAINHLIASFPQPDHLQHQLGWILKISIEDDDGASAGMGQTRGDGKLVAEIPR